MLGYELKREAKHEEEFREKYSITTSEQSEACEGLNSHLTVIKPVCPQ